MTVSRLDTLASQAVPADRSAVAAPPYASLSIIVPTYREAAALPALVARIDAVRREYALDLELLIMDDPSGDGTEAVIAGTGHDWVRYVARQGKRGLSPAVLDGLRLATHEFLVVMDADLSHPPEAIPEMIQALRDGHEFVIGSRYAEGGTTDSDWGVFRWLNSKVATLLAWPFTSARDPMSGFLAFRKTLLDKADHLNPVGYKIGLELIVKAGVRDVHEVPIHFSDRVHGESKLTWKEQAKYIQHLRRLFIYSHPNLACMLQFAVVGAAGTVVNLLVLTALLVVAVPFTIATAAAIAISMFTNFLLNRRFTFSYAMDGSMVKQFGGFVAACLLGAAVNYGVTLWVFEKTPVSIPQVAALIGILAGMGVNFVFNRFFVFKKPED